MSHDPLSRATDESVALRAWEILYRRRALAFAVFTTLLVSAMSFAVYLPDLYQTSALVLVERQLSDNYVRPSASGELESRLHVIKQEILSRSRLTEIVERFNLYPKERAHGPMESVLEQTRRDIQVEPSGPEQVSGRTKTVAFRLSYTGENRESVADVTNAIAAFYIAQNDRMRSEEATRTTEFLKDQLAEAKKQLDHHEQNVRAFTARHTGELPQQVGLNLATLSRLNDQLRLNGDKQLKVLEQRDRVIDGLVAAEPGVPASVAAPPFASDSSESVKRLDRMKDDLQQLETRFTAKHPDVMRLKDEITALEKEVAVRGAAEERAAAEWAEKTTLPARPVSPARRRATEAIDAELDRLNKTEADVRQAISTFERRLEGAPGLQQEYSLLSRDQQATKDTYDSLLRKYDEAQLTRSMEVDRQGERFRVLESALPPDGPRAPNRPRLLILGLMLAVGATAASVLLVEHLDSSFHKLDELRAFTTVPVLASIPVIGGSTRGRRVRTAVGMASILLVIGLAGVISAQLASGNEPLVRFLVRAG